MVIRNEERVLTRCLESIKNVVDEIVIVHDGPCIDKSAEIANKYHAKLFLRPLIGEAEYHRPFSFTKSRGEWILQIDADEFLSEKAKKEISKLVLTSNIDAYSLLWPYPDKNGVYIKTGPFSKTLKPCLFRKNKMYMLGISHEYPRSYGISEKRKDILLEHKPLYDNFTRDYFSRKWIDWTVLQAKQIYHLEKTPKFNMDDTNNVYKYYQDLRLHPVISGIKETFKFIAIYISRGILWSGVRSLKIAIFELAYLWLVRKNLILLKHGQRI